MLVLAVPCPVETLPAHSYCAVRDLSLSTQEGGAEGEVVHPGLLVVAALVVVAGQHRHHTARPLQ